MTSSIQTEEQYFQSSTTALTSASTSLASAISAVGTTGQEVNSTHGIASGNWGKDVENCFSQRSSTIQELITICGQLAKVLAEGSASYTASDQASAQNITSSFKS